MSDSVYSFRAGPTYRGATRAEMFDAAMDMPLSMGATFFDQAKGGVLESFGLGTVARESSLPSGAPTRPNRFEPAESFEKRKAEANPLAQDAYKASPYFRDEIPWDAGMTEDRAAALALMYDAKKVREYYASKRPITAFFGNVAGQAFDPINYIPVAGPAVKAAAVARFGKVAGTAAAASLDAAANTALAGMATAPVRAKFGDDVSWEAMVSQIATAALIGAGFGAVAGALGKRADARLVKETEQRLATLRNTQEARVALNEGIDALVRGDDLALSPNSTGPLARIAAEVEGISRAYDTVRDSPSGPVRDPLVAISPEDIDGTLIARGAFKDINEVEFSKRGWGLVKIVWGHGDKSAEPPEFQITKGDITALPEVIRRFEPSSVSQDGLRREWRVERDGRTVVYADSVMGEEGRHLVTAYVPRKPDDQKMPLSKERPALPGSRPQAGNLVEDTAGGRSIGTPGAGQSMPARRNIARSAAIDNSMARAEPIPEGRPQAETRIAKPDDYKAMAAQYRVDPNTGSFAEEAEIAQLASEGRLTEEDAATLADAQEVLDDGAAYGEALKSVAGCLI